MGERLHVKRVVDRNQSVWWVLYPEGNISRPLAVLADYELVQLKAEVDEQAPKEEARDDR